MTNKITLAIVTLAAIAIVGTFVNIAPAAEAAKPNNQACLGDDFSGYAKDGPGVGGFVSSIATTSTQGIGNEVQAHLAGQVPDSFIPNSCND